MALQEGCIFYWYAPCNVLSRVCVLCVCLRTLDTAAEDDTDDDDDKWIDE